MAGPDAAPPPAGRVGLLLLVLLGYGLAALAGFVLLPLAFMMFDAPGSESSPLTLALFAAVLAFPMAALAVVLAALLYWVAWRRLPPLFWLLPPWLDLAAIALLVGAINRTCGGQLAC